MKFYKCKNSNEIIIKIKENESWGLVLQKDQVVIDSYNEFSSGFGRISVNEKFNRHYQCI